MNLKEKYKWICSQFFVLVLIVVMLSSCHTTTQEFDRHFVHTVFIWLKNPESQEDRALFEKSLHTFLTTSKYAKTNFVGKPAGTDREVVDNSYTYSIVVTFSSKEEQDLYQKEEAHLQFVKEASSVWNKVVVYDAISID